MDRADERAAADQEATAAADQEATAAADQEATAVETRERAGVETVPTDAAVAAAALAAVELVAVALRAAREAMPLAAHLVPFVWSRSYLTRAERRAQSWQRM